MNRREFLKSCGKAGLVLGAGGVFSASVVRRASAGAEDGPKLIKLHGSPKDMGRQYAEQIGELVVERLKRLEEKGSRVTRKTVEESRIFLSVSAGDILTEIESLAAAIEWQSEKLLILAAEPPGAGIRRAGCSSFAVMPKAMKDGNLWLGENVDDAGDLEKFGIVIVRHPLEGPPMMTWALAGGVGGIGMNLAGVALTMNYVDAVTKSPVAAIFPEFVANAALRQKTYKDARAVLGNTQLMDAVIYTLAHASGECDVIERTPLTFQVLGRDPLLAAAANHFVSEDLKITEPEKPVFPNSRGRLKRLTELLRRKDLAVADLRAALADVEGKPNGICRHAEPPTIASLLMCPNERVLYATQGSPDKAKYGKFTLTGR
ncbi:MAG TPA: C45 family peptidase [Planctomycetota bacterium]|nr:C45 family peptidase [Planctomycetota bacterium]